LREEALHSRRNGPNYAAFPPHHLTHKALRTKGFINAIAQAVAVGFARAESCEESDDDGQDSAGEKASRG
jgi:hypothetical protein